MISFILLTGFHIAAMPWMERAALRDLASLRPVSRGSEPDYRKRMSSLTHFAARGLWVAVLVGQLIHLGISAVATGSRQPWSEPIRVFPSVFWLVLAPATYVVFSQAGRFRRLGRELGDIQLFDLRALQWR